MYPITEPESLSLWRFRQLSGNNRWCTWNDDLPLSAASVEKCRANVHGSWSYIHADTNSDYWPLIQRRERVLNAGVDVNDYRPVTFEEMVENNRKFKAAHAGQDCAHNADETAKN